MIEWLALGLLGATLGAVIWCALFVRRKPPGDSTEAAMSHSSTLTSDR
ncbi:MAG TPA: hypothetical protein VM491_13320 [Burkholderiaceae bacterium]|nr:hypothetical protein [Burkholderiaceae bacterium]